MGHDETFNPYNHEPIEVIERKINEFVEYRRHEAYRRRLAEEAERAEMNRLSSALGKAVLYARFQLSIGDYVVFRYVYRDILVRVGRIVAAQSTDQYGDLFLDVIPAHREDGHIPTPIKLHVRKSGDGLSLHDDEYTAQIIPARYVSANVIEQMPEVHRDAYAKHIYGAK